MSCPGFEMIDLPAVHREAKEKFDEAGMGRVAEFAGRMELALGKARAGPRDILDAAQRGFSGVSSKFQSAIDDPDSLLPDAGPLAVVAQWYAGAVVNKLAAVSDEAKELVETVGRLVDDVTAPVERVKDTLEEAMGEIGDSLAALSRLPELIAAAIDGRTSLEDVAAIDLGPIRRALQCGNIDGPLDMIMGLRSALAGAVDEIAEQMDKVQDFLDRGPGMVKAAFEVPAPLCFLGACAVYPQFLQDALEMLDMVSQIDLQGIVGILKSTMETIGSLDVGSVAEPMSRFLESAGDIVGKLEAAVSGAKLASNPAAGAIVDVAQDVAEEVASMIGGQIEGLFGK